MRWWLATRLALLAAVIAAISIGSTTAAKKGAKSLVETVADNKDLKKLLRTKNNVMICYTKKSDVADLIKSVLDEVSADVKGLATVAVVDCSSKEGKKICKKMKVEPSTYSLKHYKDGDFHKDYDRMETVKSMTRFLKDPADSKLFQVLHS